MKRQKLKAQNKAEKNQKIFSTALPTIFAGQTSSTTTMIMIHEVKYLVFHFSLNKNPYIGQKPYLFSSLALFSQ